MSYQRWNFPFKDVSTDNSYEITAPSNELSENNSEIEFDHKEMIMDNTMKTMITAATAMTRTRLMTIEMSMIKLMVKENPMIMEIMWTMIFVTK